jgi:hypothetical protein
MDEKMDTSASLPTTEQVLDAETAAFQADKGQPMFNQENGHNSPFGLVENPCGQVSNCLENCKVCLSHPSNICTIGKSI